MTPVEQIKSRLSVVDVIGSYIKLDKAGSSYKALCPFHHEKTASFNVSPSRDAYYCFGCNRGGDIFTFVQEIEGIDFPEALRLLADRAGVVLKRDEHRSEERSERAKLLELMEEATKFYQKHIVSNHDAMKYLRDRGLTTETMKSFRIGYAPLPAEGGGWSACRDHLIQLGWSDQEIEKAGITKRAERGPYDRFRGRIMFPIFDANGQPVAFSGRVFGTQKTPDGTDVAKYINSPETPLFDKSAIMFGYDRAKKMIRQQNFTIIVEGQMDLIMAHQAGSTNTVAVSGTALTERHLGLLKRLSDNVIFAFDADEAGLRATTKAFSLALSLGMSVRVARIPEGKDPADYILKNPAGWAEVISGSMHIIDFYLTVLSERKLPLLELRKAVEQDVLPLVLHIKSNIERAHYVINIARKLSIPEQAVAEELKRLQMLGGFADQKREATATIPKLAPKTLRQLAEEQIIGILAWQEAHSEPSFDVIVVRTRYTERLGKHGISPYEPSPEEANAFVIRAENEYMHGPELESTIDEILNTLEREVLKEKQAQTMRKIGEAEERKDKDETSKLMKEFNEITGHNFDLENRREKQ